MHVNLMTRLAVVIGAGLIVAQCSSSTPSPAPTPNPPIEPPPPAATPVTSFVTGVTAADGTAAAQQSGAPPAASGGPTVTATSNATVINGGSDVARLQSASPFQSVYVSVGNTTGFTASGTIGARAAASGYYLLRLPAATTDAFVLVAFGRTLPANTFTLSYAVANAAGALGPTVNSTKAVNTTAATGDVQVSVSWNTATDVDLHVVDPRGDEVYWEISRVASGGALDLDSNGGCSIDNKNNENIRWPAPAPSGTYTVRVDYWSACNVTGPTTFAVVVNNGGVQSLFNGSFTANQADGGGQGSGRLITTFNRAAGITTEGVWPMDRLLPSFTPSPLKRRLSGQQPR